MAAFTKLDSGIVHSTIWIQPHDVLRTWIALLALADQNGFARTAAPSLAHLCMIPLERLREIIATLEAPDEDSRSEAHEGRRIVKVEGGWLLVNHAAYRAKRDPAADTERKRQWDRENRPSGHARQSDASPTQSDAVRPGPLAPTQAEAEAEAEAAKAKADARPKRGTRLPDSWVPSESSIALAINSLGARAQAELDKFRDYWKAAAGKSGVKLDWDAAFRYWIRNAIERGPKHATSQPRESLVDRAADRARRIFEAHPELADQPGQAVDAGRGSLGPQMDFEPR